MEERSFKSRLTKVSGSVLVNVVAGLIAAPIGFFIVWVASTSSPLLTFLFWKMWSFLTSPVAVPLGILLIVGASVLVNLLILATLKRVAPGVSHRKAISFSILLLIGLPIIIFLSWFLVYSLGPRKKPERKPPEQLTSTGNVANAAISPDGKYFVFGVNHNDGRHSVRLGQVATRTSLQILEPEVARYEGLTFSPDGLHLYFVKYEKNSLEGSLYQMATLGGQPMKILSNLPRSFGFALSPDGRRLAFVQASSQKGESALTVADAFHSEDKRVVATRMQPEPFRGVPAWSPDGSTLVCAVATQADEVKLVRLRVEDGAEEPTPFPPWKFVGQISWLSGNNGLILSASKISGPYQIWRIPYAGGEPEKITNDLHNYVSMSLTADSSTLLTVQDDLTADVHISPPGQLNTLNPVDIGKGKHNDYWGFYWTPDGRILYESMEAGNQDIWVMKPDGSGQKKLTSSGDNFDPCMTPDGRSIIFTSKRGEMVNIWKMNSDGSDPKQLTKGASDFIPFCAPNRPDGQWIVYTSALGGKSTLWKVRINGGAPVQLTESPSHWPSVSPDGKQIACFYEDEETKELMLAVIPFEGGPPVMRYRIEPTVNDRAEIRWIRGGKELTYVDNRNGVSNIWSQPVNGGNSRQLTNFSEGRIFRYEWSSDGALVLSRGSVTRDIVLISLPAY
jgi:Tol biopolymer transport system component